MSLRNEDRELQIRLAELQADVQINLAACFGFLAVFITIIIGFEQIYFSLPQEDRLLKYAISFSMHACNELRKQYVW